MSELDKTPLSEDALRALFSDDSEVRPLLRRSLWFVPDTGIFFDTEAAARRWAQHGREVVEHPIGAPHCDFDGLCVAKAPCPQHDKLRCSACGKKATRHCDGRVFLYSGRAACPISLCRGCECPYADRHDVPLEDLAARARRSRATLLPPPS